ncbi:unnamed protein product [Amoebophrya sp. A25]|nr:unnamed protein product [Amoebophrya sp. A25]|eukprot:GSA25T00013385001.1
MLLLRRSAACRGGAGVVTGPTAGVLQTSDPISYFPKYKTTPKQGLKQAPSRYPTYGKYVTERHSDADWMRETAFSGINMMMPWRQPIRQVHGDYTQCKAGTFGELKACMPKPDGLVTKSSFEDQARDILVTDALAKAGLTQDSKTSGNDNTMAQFKTGAEAGKEADKKIRELLLGGAGGYTDAYARKLLAWHISPNGETIPLPEEQDDIYTFVMDGLRDEMTIEDVALHRIRQDEERLYKQKMLVSQYVIWFLLATVIYYPIWCAPMWQPFMNRMWDITDDDDWCIRRYGRGRLYAF